MNSGSVFLLGGYLLWSRTKLAIARKDRISRIAPKVFQLPVEPVALNMMDGQINIHMACTKKGDPHGYAQLHHKASHLEGQVTRGSCVVDVRFSVDAHLTKEGQGQFEVHRTRDLDLFQSMDVRLMPHRSGISLEPDCAMIQFHIGIGPT